MKTFLPSELPPPMFILLLLSFGGKKIISNGKNNSQLLMDNFVISRFGIIEEIALVYIMEVMKSKESLVEAGTKG